MPSERNSMETNNAAEVLTQLIRKTIDAIEIAVRWHYYDLQRGHHTADPQHSGMSSEALEPLIEVLGPTRRQELEVEGLAWAQAELELPYGPPLWGTLPWSEYKKQCTGK